MIMTDDQKFSVVLKELGELLQEKNTTISIQSWQIDQLKEKLSCAEYEREKATERAMELDQQLLDALCEIEQLKGGAS